MNVTIVNNTAAVYSVTGCIIDDKRGKVLVEGDIKPFYT